MKANKYDAYAKVKRTIESCRTDKQLNVAKKMFSNFTKIYNDCYLDNNLSEIIENKKYYVTITL